MYSFKRQKIDLSTDYPCPCRRKARLKPILLTEALGCDRCPNVFVLTAEGDQVEQIAGLPLSRKSWWWTGQQWVLAQAKQNRRGWLVWVLSWLVTMGGLGLLLLIYLPGQVAVWGCVLAVLICPMVFDSLRQWWIDRSQDS